MGQNMEDDKISENPRKGFLQSLDRGMNKIKKLIYFLFLYLGSDPLKMSWICIPGYKHYNLSMYMYCTG